MSTMYYVRIIKEERDLSLFKTEKEAEARGFLLFSSIPSAVRFEVCKLESIDSTIPDTEEE